MQKSDLASIRALVQSTPYPPALPRRSVWVNLAMWLGQRTGGMSTYTPHSCGGTDDAKVQYDYDQEIEESFWDIVRDHAPSGVLEGADLLDIGCGWGGKSIYYAEHYPVRSVTGFDLPGVFDPAVPAQYAEERGLSNCSFISGYAEDIPLPDDQFDVVIMDDVLEHVADPEAVLRESRRVLRPGGLLIARFPSIRMMQAHHFDRALKLPGLHYLLPWRTWAGGFNYYLLHGRKKCTYEPFAEVRPTAFHKGLTMGLNGMDYKAFKGVADRSGLAIRSLGMVGFPRAKFGARGWAFTLYQALRSIPPLHEVLSRSIVFVGEKKGE
jgi:SAM-dependent methyltransferase